MQLNPRPELPASLFSRPLKHARYVAVLIVGGLLVCGRGAFHRRLSSIGPSRDELPPDFEKHNGPNFDQGEGPSNGIGGGGGGGGGNSSSVPAGFAQPLQSSEEASRTDFADRGEFEERQEAREERGAVVPPCYSSPDADPSEGVWRKADGGVSESPAMRGSLDLPTTQFGFLHACQCTWSRQHPGDQETQPYWVWEPKNCALEAVTSEKFCQVMEERKGLLLVGDSLTRLSTTTLASVLRAKPISVSQLEDEWSACGGRLRLRFMRNDFLDVRTSPFGTVQCRLKNGTTADNTRCIVFADKGTLEKFDTLVVNSGAHPRPGEEYGPAMRAASESLAASMKLLHGDDAVLIARNTVPGHWGCTERIFDGPAERSVATGLVSAAPPEYRWDTFGDSNALLAEAFSPNTGWRLLDAFSPTVLRADGHIGGKDCLHYCLPGPADHWIVLLYNILLESANGSQ